MVLHPPTPYTLSPLLKGGEGRGEGGSYTHVPCPFGALLVALYQIFSKGFLNGKRDIGSGASPQRGWRHLKRKSIPGNSITGSFWRCYRRKEEHSFGMRGIRCFLTSEPYSAGMHFATTDNLVEIDS
jgi:hypothetical protein